MDPGACALAPPLGGQVVRVFAGVTVRLLFTSSSAIRAQRPPPR